MTDVGKAEGVKSGHVREPQWVVPDLTLFIPTVGRPQLDTCLTAIANGTAQPSSVIVVDQGESAEVATWIRDAIANGLDVLHLVSSGRSPSSARNHAIERITTPFAAAIDDDCVPAPDWLERMRDCLHRHPAAVITGRCLPAGGGVAPTIVTSQVPRIHTRPSRRFPSPLASGNMGFALETARRIGVFDERLPQAEDNDWAYRALRAGIPIVYAPEVVVDHVHWRSDTELAAVYRAYSRSQGAFYGKHIRRGDWRMGLRAGEYLLRSGKMFLHGLATNDPHRRSSGLMRGTQLLSGLVSGVRGREPR